MICRFVGGITPVEGWGVQMQSPEPRVKGDKGRPEYRGEASRARRRAKKTARKARCALKQSLRILAMAETFKGAGAPAGPA